MKKFTKQVKHKVTTVCLTVLLSKQNKIPYKYQPELINKLYL